jgi:opacity protein-like surface antigen
MQRIMNQSGWKLLSRLSLCFALLATAAGLLRAQAVYAAHESNRFLWAGGECGDFSASFPYQSNQRMFGCGLTANARWTYHIDVEGTARWLGNGYAGTTERTLLIGPRYIIHRFGYFEPYGKFLVGDGTINYPYSIGTDSYFTLAPGGGVNVRVMPKLNVRVEYEYQFWLNSPGFTNEPNHPLHPNGVNVGVVYRLWRF